MRTEQLATSEAEGVVPPVIFYITDRSKAVLLIWFSVFACFGVSFHLCIKMIFS